METDRSAAGKRRARKERGLTQLADGRWRASWYDGPHYIRRVFQTKGEARLARESVRVKKAEGRYISREKEVTIEKAVEKFLEWSEANMRKTSQQTDRRVAKEWLACPFFAGKTLDKITAGDVESYRLARLKEPNRGNGKALRGLLEYAAKLHKTRTGRTLKGRRRTPVIAALAPLLQAYHPARIEEALSWWFGERSGEVDLSTIGEELLDRVKANPAKIKDKPVGRRTPDVCLSRLKRLFNKAMEWGLTDRNPAARVKLLKEDVNRCRILSPEEESRLFGVCSADLGRVVRFAIHTGMRRAEILGLRWQDVNFVSGVATIPGTRAKGKRDRHVPLNPVAVSVLEALPRSIDPTALVFGNSEGGQWDRLRKQWPLAVTQAELGDFRFHDLRHTFASRLVMRGVDLYVVMELLGHRDIRQTQRYAHLQPGRLASAVLLLAPEPNQHLINIPPPNAEAPHLPEVEVSA